MIKYICFVIAICDLVHGVGTIRGLCLLLCGVGTIRGLCLLLCGVGTIRGLCLLLCVMIDCTFLSHNRFCSVLIIYSIWKYILKSE